MGACFMGALGALILPISLNWSENIYCKYIFFVRECSEMQNN